MASNRPSYCGHPVFGINLFLSTINAETTISSNRASSDTVTFNNVTGSPFNETVLLPLELTEAFVAVLLRFLGK